MRGGNLKEYTEEQKAEETPRGAIKTAYTLEAVAESEHIKRPSKMMMYMSRK